MEEGFFVSKKARKQESKELGKQGKQGKQRRKKARRQEGKMEKWKNGEFPEAFPKRKPLRKSFSFFFARPRTRETGEFFYLPSTPILRFGRRSSINVLLCKANLANIARFIEDRRTRPAAILAFGVIQLVENL